MKKSLWVLILAIVNLPSEAESVFMYDASVETGESPSESDEEYVFSRSEEKEELPLESAEPEHELNGFQSPDDFSLFQSGEESKSERVEKANVEDQGHSYRGMTKSSEHNAGNNIMLNETKEDYSNIGNKKVGEESGSVLTATTTGSYDEKSTDSVLDESQNMESDESYDSKSVDSSYGLSAENVNTMTTPTTVTHSTATPNESATITSAWRNNPTTMTPSVLKSNATNIRTPQRRPTSRTTMELTTRTSTSSRSPMMTKSLIESGGRLMPKLKGSDIIGSSEKSWHWESESVESTTTAVKQAAKGLKSKERSWHWESLTEEESDKYDDRETTKKVEDIRNQKSLTNLKHASSKNDIEEKSRGIANLRGKKHYRNYQNKAKTPFPPDTIIDPRQVGTKLLAQERRAPERNPVKLDLPYFKNSIECTEKNEGAKFSSPSGNHSQYFKCTKGAKKLLFCPKNSIFWVSLRCCVRIKDFPCYQNCVISEK